MLARDRQRRRLTTTFVAIVLGLIISTQATPVSAADVPIGKGVSFGTIASGGRMRSYRIFVPKVRAGARLPVVFVLHGGLLGTPFQVARNTRFDDEASRRGFIAVYPWGVANTWNAGTCCGRAMKDDVDDVAFVADLLDELESRFRVDTRRVFATGMSNGGMMAYRLGCELSDRIAAIGPVASTMTIACNPSSTVAVVHIHGLEDQHVPYEGGVGSKGVAKDYRQPVPKSIDRWRKIDNCPAPVRTTHGEVTTSTSTPCSDATAVTLITVANAGHTWPGGSDETRLSAVIVDPSNDEIDATRAISDFFAAHPKTG